MGGVAATSAAGSRRATVFWLFTGAYFLSYFFRSANAVLAGDLARDLALSAAQLGLMTSLFYAAFALAQLPLGAGLDRWGPRVVVPAMLLVAALGSLVFGAARSFAVLALGRALIGLGVAIILPSAFKMMSMWYPPGRVATMSGLVIGLGASGAVVAATPLAWLNARTGWRAIFLGVALVVGLAALAIALWARNTPGDVPWPARTPGEGAFQQLFTDRRFWRMGPLNFFFTGTVLGMQGLWAGPYLRDVAGLAPVAAGNVLLLLAFGAAAGYGASGWLSDRLGVGRVIVTSSLVFTLCQLLLASRPPLAAVAAVYLVFGFSGAFCIMLMAHARLIFPAAMTGQAVAAMNFFGIGGTFCLQWCIGLIIGAFSATAPGHYAPAAYTVALLCTAAGTLLTLAWYAPLARHGSASLTAADR